MAHVVLEHVETTFREKPGGAASRSVRRNLERWLYELALYSDDGFCREKASLILNYGTAYFSGARHQLYGRGKTSGLDILQNQVSAAIEALKLRLAGLRPHSSLPRSPEFPT